MKYTLTYLPIVKDPKKKKLSTSWFQILLSREVVEYAFLQEK